MMNKINILCDRLPDSVSLDGKEYPVYTDFRRWILMLDLFDSCKKDSPDRLDPLTAARCAARIAIRSDDDPCDLSDDTLIRLLNELAVFALGGDEPEPHDSGRHSPAERVIDFSCDAGLILSAFLSSYSIDLTKTSMHWWKFLALLRALPADTDLMHVISLRSCDTTKIGDDELRRRMRRAKAAVRIRRPGVSDKK